MRKIIIIAIGCLMATHSFGKTLTPEDALERLNQSAPAKLKSLNTNLSASKLVYTYSKNNRPLTYLFSNPDNGFILVSADDCATPLLGYGDQKLFSESIPSHLMHWMEQYGFEIEAAYDNKNSKTRELSAQRPDRNPIAPLCATRWGESYPYNGDCPEIGGKQADAGNIATAMAQIMKFHNWPTAGTGTNSYPCHGQNLSMDFANHPFDWNNMKNAYSSVPDEDDEVSRKAVSNLMYACGISMNMDYDNYSSTANFYNLPLSMTKYFDYSPSTTIKERKYYDLCEWENTVYKSLQDNAPVIYYANSTSGSSLTFVCDGYDGDGYFHINWGKSGECNGFYLLSALTPATPQGDTPFGAGRNFGLNHIALVEAMPAKNDDKPMTEVVNENSISCKYDSGNGEIIVSGPFRYYGATEQTLEFGIEVEDAKGNTSICHSTDMPSISYAKRIESIRVPFSPENDGTYMVYPVVTDNATGQPKRIPAPYHKRGEARMTVKGNYVSFEVDSVKHPTVKNLKINTPLYMNNAFEVEFDLENQSDKERTDEYRVYILADEDLNWVCSGRVITLAPGESSHIVYQDYMGIFFGLDKLPEVEVGVVLKSSEKQWVFLGEPLHVQLGNAPGGDTYKGSNMLIENAENVDPANICFSFDVEVIKGFFAWKIWASVFNAETDEKVFGISLPGGYEFCKAGDSMNVQRSLKNLKLQGETEYILRVYPDINLTPPEAVGHLTEGRFKTKAAGIYDTCGDINTTRILATDCGILIEAPIDGITYNVYSVDGKTMSSGITTSGKTFVDVPKGIYIVRAGSTTAKVFR